MLMDMNLNLHTSISSNIFKSIDIRYSCQVGKKMLSFCKMTYISVERGIKIGAHSQEENKQKPYR